MWMCPSSQVRTKHLQGFVEHLRDVHVFFQRFGHRAGCQSVSVRAHLERMAKQIGVLLPPGVVEES